MSSDYFFEYGVVKAVSRSSAVAIVLDAIPDPHDNPELSSSSFVSAAWNRVESHPSYRDSLRGQIFEFVLAATLIRSGILPFYVQAQIQFVPNVNFDFVVWTRDSGPIVISAKTSLRERYKQADLEAMALANVHRRAESYLVTLDRGEALRLKARIRTGAVLALTDVVVADGSEFDELIKALFAHTRIEAPSFQAVESGNLVRVARIGGHDNEERS